MSETPDRSVLDAQRSHWESTLHSNSDMYGLEPSDSGRAAIARFRSENFTTVLELGAGQGRDTLPLAEAGFAVTAADYSETGLSRIEARADQMGVEVETRRCDVREPLPFSDDTFDGCYSHMLFCMALTTTQLRALAAEVRRVLRPGGLVVYTARSTDDAHFEAGIPRGDDMFEHGGFVVHFFSAALIDELSDGFEIVDRFEFEEGALPRRLVAVTMRRLPEAD